MNKEENNNIIIYQTEDGVTQIEMADLYRTTRPNIVQHIRNIYEEGELEDVATCKNFLQVRQEGKP